jgi:trimethyllysine dioxygenase
MTTIERLDPADDGLHVQWGDGASSCYPWLWLRDHAHDKATTHPVTRQRLIETAALPADLRATAVLPLDGDVRITWAGLAETTVLPIEFLHRFRSPEPADITSAPTPTLWDAAIIAGAPLWVDHDRVMAGDDGLRDWLRTVATWGFAIVTGTPPTAEASERLLRRIGYVRETIFGGFWEFTADLKMADLAYTNVYLPAHTDATYSNDAPGAQMLHCLHFDGTGGESTIVDGFKIADVLRTEAPELFATLSQVPIPGRYIGDGSHLMAARPVFRHDHRGVLVQVSYNNADRAPFLLPAEEMTQLYAALRAFDDLANSASMRWSHVLRPGEALLFDNWRALHGRFAYTGKRMLCGGYLNREDFESRLRLLP